MYLVIRVNLVPARIMDEMKNPVRTIAEVRAIAAIAEVQIWYKRPTPVEVPHTFVVGGWGEFFDTDICPAGHLIVDVGGGLAGFLGYTKKPLGTGMSLHMCGTGALPTTTFLSTTLKLNSFSPEISGRSSLHCILKLLEGKG